jgi:hypothetical protein
VERDSEDRIYFFTGKKALRLILSKTGLYEIKIPERGRGISISISISTSGRKLRKETLADALYM